VINSVLKEFLNCLQEHFVYLVTLILILAYPIGLYALKNKGKIDEDTLAVGLTSFVGWIVALLIAWIHLRKNRLDNFLLKKQETKKRLEIEAFRELNKAISNFSSTLSSISVPYWTWPGKIKLYRQNPQVFSFDIREIDLKISEQIIKMGYAELDFVTTIEAHEIVVLQFDYLRKFIYLRIEDIKEAIEEFRSYYISKINIEYLKENEGYSEFKKRCNEMNRRFVNIQMYLYDYRIILMNFFLGDVFENVVPERKPKDPEYKTLTEIAKKEYVEREFDERQQKILDKGKYL